MFGVQSEGAAVIGSRQREEEIRLRRKVLVEPASILSYPEGQEGEGVLQCPLQTERRAVRWSMQSLLVGIILMPMSLCPLVCQGGHRASCKLPSAYLKNCLGGKTERPRQKQMEAAGAEVFSPGPSRSH